MSDQPIYLEASEEITSVIDRLRKAEGKAVAFMVPAGATLIQSIVNLKLLKRAADSGGKTVEIVTGDRMGRNLATQVGFTVFGSLDDLKASKPFKAAALPKKAAAVTGMADIAAAKPVPTVAPLKMKSRAVPEELPVAEEVPSPAPAPVKDAPKAVAKVEKADPPPSKAAKGAGLIGGAPKLGMPSFGFMKGKKSLYIGGALAALLLVILLVTYVFATATITITPKADPVTAESDVTASKAVTTVSESGTIPAQVVTQTESENSSFQATGQKDVGTKATGNATLTNCADSTRTFTIPAGSTLSAGGASYLTNSTVTIPAGVFTPGCNRSASSVAVGITAAASGAQYNAGSMALAIPGVPSGVSGSGSASGGTTKVVTIISQADLDNAKASLSQKAQAASTTDLKKKLSSDQPVLDGATSVAVTSFTPSAPLGTQTSSFTAQEAATATLLTYHKSDLQKVLIDTVKNKVSGNKQIIPGSQGVQAQVTALDAAGGTLQLHGSLNGFIADKFDTGSLAKSVTGKTVTQARKTFLQNTGIAETDISVWPSYKGRLPFWAGKITIKIATPKTNS
jgi:hypothetical protein